MDGPVHKLDFATVVFRDELPLLRLQARSFDRWMPSENVGTIFVIINDQNEDACVRAVEALRSDYGAFSDRLRVVQPAEIMLKEPANIAGHVERFWVRHLLGYKRAIPIPRKNRNPVGWVGNNGWAMQQAFKLQIAALAEGSHVVILDSKNHFIGPVDASDFVSADGRARSRKSLPSAKLRSWIVASFEALGLTPPPEGTLAPPVTTPVVVSTQNMKRALAHIQERVGPLESYFARGSRLASEFMLLYASIDQGKGLWWVEHTDDLAPTMSVVRTSDEADLLRKFDEARRKSDSQDLRIAALHRRILQHLGPAAQEKIFGFLTERGLLSSIGEGRELFQPSNG